MERWEIMKYVKLPKRSIIISKGEGRSGLLGKGEQNSGRAPQEIFVKFLLKIRKTFNLKCNYNKAIIIVCMWTNRQPSTPL